MNTELSTVTPAVVPATEPTIKADAPEQTKEQKTANAEAEMKSSPAYTEAYAIGKAYGDATADTDDALSLLGVAIIDGDKARYKAARQGLADGLEAGGLAAESARTEVYRLMRRAGIVAPGKQGKRKDKAEPAIVDTSVKAWMKCYETADWTAARRIMARLAADAGTRKAKS